MTNPKKPREPRKPLDQSFLEFVHGDPPSSTASEPVPHTSDLEQELVELQRCFTQLESSTHQNLGHVSQVEAHLMQLAQKVEQMEKANQPVVGLQQQLENLERTLADRESRQFSQVEQQLTHLAQHVEQLGADVRKLCADLHHYSTQAEAATANQANHIRQGERLELAGTTPPVEPESSQSPLPSYPDAVPQRSPASDSLLNWISPLLDNF